MYGVCLQANSSKTVHSFMCARPDKTQKLLVLIRLLTPKTFLSYSKFCENFIKKF